MYLSLGYLERCVNGQCKVQQDNNGQVLTPKLCPDCQSKISGSTCSPDNRCKCLPTYSIDASGTRCIMDPLDQTSPGLATTL